MTITQRHIKHFFFAVFLTAVVATTQSARAQKWMQWRSTDGGNSHYYALTPHPTNWIAAQRLAASWGGTLATITSSNEQSFINTTFLTGAFEHKPVWIGLLYPATKGTVIGTVRHAKEQFGIPVEARAFEWVTGEPFAYTNWKPGEPNNSGPSEDYVAINWEYSKNPSSGLTGEWNDTPLEGTTGYSGNSDGPYFGVMERTMDRDQPKASPGFNWLLLLLAVLLVLLIAWISRKKRSRTIPP